MGFYHTRSADSKSMSTAGFVRRSLGFALGGLLMTLPSFAFAYESVTTLAGLTEQAALASRLHRRMIQRFVHPLGLFESLRLDLNAMSEPQARNLYGRLVNLDPAQGYAPDWQPDGTHVLPQGRQHVLGWLAAGSVIENVPAARMRNHFLNPRTGLGLHTQDGDSSLDTSLHAVKYGVSSLRQFLAGAALDGNGMSAADWVAAPKDINELGLDAFLTAYARAERATLPAERESALAQMLLIVGGMLGVLEQMGDPAYLRSDFEAVLTGGGELELAERFGRAAIPAPAPLAAELEKPPQHLRDLFLDGKGGGLAEQTARRCAQPLPCYTKDAHALLAQVGRYGQRLIDYLFRGELRLGLQEDGKRLTVIAAELPMGPGTLSLLGELQEGRRQVLRTLDVPATNVGAALTEFSLTQEERQDLHRLVVLFQGRDREGEPLVSSAQIVLP